MNKIILSLFSILILFFITPSYSEEKFISGESRSVKVIDGDTIKINGENIRLHGIDAPEMKQICQNENNNPYACGVVAKEALYNSISKWKKKVYCYYSERDRYKRIIGKCYLGANSSNSLNKWMVSRGHAVAYTRYSNDYIEAQNQAKGFSLGIWRGKFDLPEEWRRKNK
jgi:endonuclease YncB( thermonuclease family)